ncbi:unnamed protein product [marine sediment metagenome]|uniref:Uncharacterized protein n=1 Tax=marine sediment metagenome TaxID=412755 RepID=X1DLR5_9ZZZZ
MARVKLELVESKKEIQAKINKALKAEIDGMLVKAAGKMIDPIRRALETELKNSPEVLSLSGGQLMKKFGLPNGRTRINEIISL